jgi:hypothetical protein
MFGFSYPATMTPNMPAMERRLRKLEGQFEQVGRASGRRPGPASLKSATRLGRQ